MNDGGDCRAAPATPGLLIICFYKTGAFLLKKKKQVRIIFFASSSIYIVWPVIKSLNETLCEKWQICINLQKALPQRRGWIQ